jgi:hypothetical protein
MHQKKNNKKEKKIIAELKPVLDNCRDFSMRADESASSIIKAGSIVISIVGSAVLISTRTDTRLIFAALPVLVGILIALGAALGLRISSLSTGRLEQHLEPKEESCTIYYWGIARLSLSEFIALVLPLPEVTDQKALRKVKSTYAVLASGGKRYQLLMLSTIAFISGLILSTTAILLIFLAG